MKFAAALIFSFCFVVLFAGCKKGPAWKNEVYEEHSVKPQSGEVKIPSSLWTRIVALTAPGKAAERDKSGEKAKEEGAEEESTHPETTFEPLKVYLIERNKGVLKGHNIALSFAAGGGELDLGDYVQPLRGSFYVVFDFLPAIEKANTQVFFLSNSLMRKIGSEVIGSGCDKYFDLSKASAEAMKNSGFLVNTSDQRHVSALAGTYVFASTYDGKLHLASLIIRDESHRALQCRR